MRLEPLLAEFASRHRLPPFSADERGDYALTVDTVLEMTIAPRGSGHALVSATIGARPDATPAGDAAVLRLLRLHFARSREHREILACEDGKVVQTLPLALGELSVDDFDQELAAFADALEFWRDQLAAVDTRRFVRPPMTMLFP